MRSGCAALLAVVVLVSLWSSHPKEDPSCTDLYVFMQHFSCSKRAGPFDGVLACLSVFKFHSALISFEIFALFDRLTLISVLHAVICMKCRKIAKALYMHVCVESCSGLRVQGT